MDFLKIKETTTRSGTVEIWPDFVVRRSKDLMIKGKNFYAIWDDASKLWSRDDYTVQTLVDEELNRYRESMVSRPGIPIFIRYMSDFSTNAWTRFRNYTAQMADNSKPLDEKIVYSSDISKREDYASRKLSYDLDSTSEPVAYNKMMSVLYSPKERQKLEWAVGSIFAGASSSIQKFIVIYGEPGSGKSTFFNIVQQLFDGYYNAFDAKAIISSSNVFATETFRNNPLVAIDHDADLSVIFDNAKLNSIVSHEQMTMNEKYKPAYSDRIRAFLFVGTNKPVHITDAKSGILRRLIDVSPTGNTLPVMDYFSLMGQIGFELGAIANHCIEVYRKLGKNYYALYKPTEMIFQTDVFFNFVDTYCEFLSKDEGVSLSRAYSLYKEFIADSSLKFQLPRYKFREELRNYFEEFLDIARDSDGKQVRSLFKGFKKEKFKDKQPEVVETPSWLVLDKTSSLLDTSLSSCPAQYAHPKFQTPYDKWDAVTSKLSDIDTGQLHYVILPENHIVIDFDLVDETGNKSITANIKAASLWPPTYAEYSKSGAGIHLHYIWNGDAQELVRLYSPGIEVKVPSGHAALRRKVSRCNDIPVTTISSGIQKRKVKMVDKDVILSEKSLRALIEKNLRKEIHPATKPSVDFIYKLLDDAYKNGIPYDVRDLRPRVLVFANNSTNNASYCVKLVAKMKFNSEEESPDLGDYKDNVLVFFDVEVFPNLFVICWKYAGSDSCVHMINPSPSDVEKLFEMPLVGFNNRRYDNHILYAAYLGYSPEMLYDLSTRIIGDQKRALFGDAYNLSYADVYDFSSKKQSLKKWQIELGIFHSELPYRWDEVISEEHWPEVIKYCDNDVISTEAVFNARKEDFVARKILSDLSGLTVNASTLSHTAKIIFGDSKRPQNDFVYTNLAEMFPGYSHVKGVSEYKGENPGEGGYVYAEPGFYRNVTLLDVASMHPTSIRLLNLFGPYTKKYTDLLDARLAVKRKELDQAIEILPGLEKYLASGEDTKALAYALKIVINIVYGLTSASFENPFVDPRNKDNIVAKRGALFMIDLKYALQERGCTVAHIKTDSVKIPNASEEDVSFVIDFGKRYGYYFEVEAVYDKLLLVNDAVYVAKGSDGVWTATGKEFQHPYIFKTLFSHEQITFEDLCEARSVTTSLYLDLNEKLGEGEHNYVFVGKTGSFVPILPGKGGGILLREKEGQFHSANGSKGFRWLESQHVKELGLEAAIDYSFYQSLVDEAESHISAFVSLQEFLD